MPSTCPARLTRNRLIAGLALFASLAGVIALAHAGGEPAAPERTPVRGCETRVESELFSMRQLPPFWRRREVRAGPVVLLAGEFARRPASDFAHVPGRPGRYYEQKLLLIVRAGAVATIVVPKRERERFALLYDRSKWGIPYRVGRPIAGGDRAVRFRACREDHPTFTRRGTVGAWTEFNGGVLVAGPQCTAIDVHVNGREKPIRRFLAFGVGRPGCKPQRASSASSEAPRPNAVLYGIGVSTDSYGKSQPQGVGVAAGIVSGRLRRSEFRGRGLSPRGSLWLGSDRILVPRTAPPFRSPLILGLQARNLGLLSPAPVRPLEVAAIFSPNSRLVATEPVEVIDCERGVKPGTTCWRAGGVVYVANADGSSRRRVWRGHLLGWTPDSRLLVTDYRYLRESVLHLDTGRRTSLLRAGVLKRFAGVGGALDGTPIWSADRRYFAAYASFGWSKEERRRKVNAFVIARTDGRVVRIVTSRYIISMLVWSPAGHRLAYTTSGFPNPHELFVLDSPAARQRKVFETSNRHFDWITWSPDGRYLLLDDPSFRLRPRGRWVLFDVGSGKIVRVLPRLGGAPLWCCPAGAYATQY